MSKKFFLLIAIFLSFLILVAPAMARDYSLSNNNALTSQDTKLLFGKNKLDNFQVSYLSEQELKDTEGEWYWTAAKIGVSAGLSIYNYHKTTTNRTYGGYATAALWGATLGGRAAVYKLGGRIGSAYAFVSNSGLNYLRYRFGR